MLNIITLAVMCCSYCVWLPATLLPDAQLIMRVSACVCVCVCRIISCVQNMSKSYKRIVMKSCGDMEHGPGRNQLYFDDDPDSFLDPGSFSRILYH